MSALGSNRRTPSSRHTIDPRPPSTLLVTPGSESRPPGSHLAARSRELAPAPDRGGAGNQPPSLAGRAGLRHRPRAHAKRRLPLRRVGDSRCSDAGHRAGAGGAGPAALALSRAPGPTAPQRPLHRSAPPLVCADLRPPRHERRPQHRRTHLGTGDTDAGESHTAGAFTNASCGGAPPAPRSGPPRYRLAYRLPGGRRPPARRDPRQHRLGIPPLGARRPLPGGQRPPRSG